MFCFDCFRIKAIDFYVTENSYSLSRLDFFKALMPDYSDRLGMCGVIGQRGQGPCLLG